MDFIATDHAPHTEEEKDAGFEKAPFGITGLETAFPLLYTHFVKEGKWTLKQLVDWMTQKPAEVFGMPYGKIEVGAQADLSAYRLEQESRQSTANIFITREKHTIRWLELCRLASQDNLRRKHRLARSSG